MAKSLIKGIEIKSDTAFLMRVFEIFAKVLAFGALYLTLFSALPYSLGRYLAVLVGAVFSVVYLVFKNNKILKYAVLGAAVIYTVLCIAVSFNDFYAGLTSFLNGIVTSANNNMHWGFARFNGEASAAGDFLFASVVSVWLAIAIAVIGSGKVHIICSAAIVFVWLFLGLYPSGYALVVLAFSFVGMLASDRGFTLKATLCYLGCAAVFFGALAPCFIYGGSNAVKGVKNSITSSLESVFYGKDSLPEGKLKNSYNMCSSEELMLEVELSSQTRNLYLKGFVGGELYGSEWQPTDKNVYVGNDYQGLIEYISSVGLPFSQYAQYSALSGKNETFGITVRNVAANSKYVYSPYTLSEFSAGSGYYDLNLRGGIFTPSEYSFTAYTRNRNCEWISQAQWLLNSGMRTQAMQEYLAYEGEYRAFVSDVYREVDEEKRSAIGDSVINISGGSINTVTQLIRRYFLDNYIYSDVPDQTGNDFMSDFFGGRISNANSAYFASAATYMFREYGFAARYAEGYFIRLEKAVSASVLPVTCRNTHAWVEVYFDGIGWLPIEVTPTFFSEEEMNTPPVPDNENKPDEPQEPEIPPVTPEEPPIPDDPEINKKPLTPEEKGIVTALTVLIPIASVALAVVLTALAVLLNRKFRLKAKRNKLRVQGEEFGRTVYAMMERDCKPFGGFTQETLEKYGVTEKSTARFMQLIEKSVYGGYNLTVNERYFVTDYIKDVASAISESGGKVKKFYCKYIKCLGI